MLLKYLCYYHGHNGYCNATTATAHVEEGAVTCHCSVEERADQALFDVQLAAKGREAA